MFKRNYYFVLEKKIGTSKVFMFMYLKNGKFLYMPSLYSGCMVTGFTAYRYWFLFNMPSWARKMFLMQPVETMFGYSHISGRVFLKRLNTGNAYK